MVTRRPANSASIPTSDTMGEKGLRESGSVAIAAQFASQVPRVPLLVFVALMGLWFMYPLATDSGPPEALYAITWNMAAINNNPFEYWITNDGDPTYGKLMEDVSTFINDPGQQDVPVSSVFTPDMFEELMASMKEAGWEGLDQVRGRWDAEYKDRKIITEFIKDPVIGKKRLASMPDRYTNTINTADGKTVMRPAVINCYEGDLGTTAKWWKAWRSFVFTESVLVNKRGGGGTEQKAIKDMLSKIKNSKYPAISLEEEAISIPLQTVAGAVFDAILVHMMNTLAPGAWQGLREGMCEKLNRKKLDRTMDILEGPYATADVQFLQEVAGAFIGKAEGRKLSTQLFDVKFPAALDSDRDQNSLILLKKGLWTDVEEVTAEISAPDGCGNGDLFALSATHAATKDKYLLASFHGDTNGLLTIPVVTAVHDYAKSSKADHKLLFGMDANTYAEPDPGKLCYVGDFAQFYVARGLNTCYGPNPNPKNFTTFHARTYLQPQLNKAIRYAEKDVKGDKNPKDFILFDAKDFSVRWTKKDNTGEKKYVEGMVFPTLAFPSDHGITSTSLAAGGGAQSLKLRGRV
jgi:hypothetical protein